MSRLRRWAPALIGTLLLLGGCGHYYYPGEGPYGPPPPPAPPMPTPERHMPPPEASLAAPSIGVAAARS
jgi:hypothetical protein